MRVVLLLTLLLAACNKPKVQDCDRATRNYFKLMYWEEAEAQIAASPPAERDAIRIQKQEELEPRMMQNIDLAVNRCVSGSSKKQVACWTKATTVKEAKACPKE